MTTRSTLRRLARLARWSAFAAAVLAATWIACERWAPQYDFPPQQWSVRDELSAILGD